MDATLKSGETGIKNEATGCSVVLDQDGRICIMAGPSCGIVLDSRSGVVTIYGAEIRTQSGPAGRPRKL